MADPRIRGVTLSPNKRGANLSKLERAKRKAHDRQKVNACPFGCEIADIDDSGYCRHLVGFANDKSGMYPFLAVDDKGRRQVSDKLVPIPADAKLIRISVSWRVYHETMALLPAPEKPKKKPTTEEMLWQKLTEQSKPQPAAKG